MSVGVFRTEQLVSCGPDIVDLDHRLGHDFALNPEIVAVNIGITDALRQDDAGEIRVIRIRRIPSADVPRGLGAMTHVRIAACVASCTHGLKLHD